MIKIASSTQIRRSTRDVFDYLADLDNLPKWQSGVLESQVVTPAPVRVGTVFEETVKVGPWRVRTTCTVTELLADRLFSFKGTSNGPIEYQGSFEMQAAEGGTRLSVAGIARLKGLWRLLEPLLAGDLRKESRAELEAIRSALEGERAESPPAVASK